MSEALAFQSTNTILYCKNWTATVAFYQDRLQLPVTYATDWFVEFRLTDEAHLSIADEARATIKSSHGAGVTLTWRVEDLDEAWHSLRRRGLEPGPIKQHAWGARVFYFYDPEGHRLEMWAPTGHGV